MTGSSDLPPLAVRETGRLYFLDNLRIALTILVIAHHVGQAYGPTGGSSLGVICVHRRESADENLLAAGTITNTKS